ncbi:serine protein kinase sky1 [Ophiostoma piceae UAMH 11346]|uniref:non-specific serine/threonine protein kinase n=1 Tax=Ophiostoma piceae (strain UAMH 11346) TaxID=1262450 RepID=S3BX63_OPHP1|nr:serine protein kinase sky1 [Ophiostoma piceae UAMH 11346]
MPRLLEAFHAAPRRFAASLRRGQALLSTSSKDKTNSARPSPRATKENRSRYVPGAYHPLRIGDIFGNGPYRVLRKLGYGVYSTVWLAHDTNGLVLLVLLADFGTASWTHDHLTEWIQPNMLRAPEVVVGAPWDCKADIWNLELVTDQLCFDGQATATANYPSEAHLAQMQAILGGFPGDMHAFLDFVKSALALGPEKRPSAQDLLSAEWLKGL